MHQGRQYRKLVTIVSHFAGAIHVLSVPYWPFSRVDTGHLAPGYARRDTQRDRCYRLLRPKSQQFMWLRSLVVKLCLSGGEVFFGVFAWHHLRLISPGQNCICFRYFFLALY